MGFVLLTVTFAAAVRRKNSASGVGHLFKIVNLVLVISFVFLSLGIGMRCVIEGHLAMTSGYETMVLLSWIVMLISIIFHRRMALLPSFGFLLSGFCLLVASISKMTPQVTNQVPVLHSPWLCLHVMLVMMAYALLSFTFLNALTVMCVAIGMRWRKGRASVDGMAEKCTMPTAFAGNMQLVSQVFLYLALAFLATGIFTGAVWANVAWGRYWSWDPKESWALITLLVYAAPIHGGWLRWFRRPMFYHSFMLVAFATLLMTYIGVNYFLGGMHSYGNG